MRWQLESVNLVPQASKLNRGHTDEGKRWRALERLCEKNPGVLVFVELRYTNLAATPMSFVYPVFDEDFEFARDEYVNSDD